MPLQGCDECRVGQILVSIVSLILSPPLLFSVEHYVSFLLSQGGELAFPSLVQESGEKLSFRAAPRSPPAPLPEERRAALRGFGREPDSHTLLLKMAHRSYPHLTISVFKKPLKDVPAVIFACVVLWCMCHLGKDKLASSSCQQTAPN